MSNHAEWIQSTDVGKSFNHNPQPERTLSSLEIKARDQPSRQWAREQALRVVQHIFLQHKGESPQLVVFAGIDHGNGCSGISAAVAETVAKTSHRRVCLVEGNFRSPSLPALFGTTNHFGLTDSLSQKGPVRSFMKPVDCTNLFLLSAGSLAPDSSNLLTGSRLKERILELRTEFEVVIIDAPPLTSYSDAIVLAQLADGLVLVIEADSTHREAASIAVSKLRSSGIPLLAAVLNKRIYPIPRLIYKHI